MSDRDPRNGFANRRRVLAGLGAATLAPAASAQGASRPGARSGVVAAGAEPAAQVGAEILRAGGNAVDAAVGAALAMAVADPANTSLAGRSHIVMLSPDGRVSVIDGRSATPRAWTPRKAESIAQSVPVPGNPRAFEKAIAEHGRLSLQQVVQPAVRLAREGFVVRSNLARVWAQRAAALAQSPSARELFLKHDGSPWRFGETFRQPKLADTLAAYGERGSAAVMSGPGIEAHVARLAADGSQLTMADFDAYRAFDAEAVTVPYRGWKVWTIGRQGYGYLQAETLQLFEALDLPRLPAPDRWAAMLLAQRVAYKDMPTGLGPEAQSLLRKDHLAKQLEIVRALAGARGELSPWFPKGKATPGESGDTTHISAVDAEGVVASITTSIGPHFGSAVAAPGGYLMAHSYQMSSGVRRADRDITAMSPTILESPAGDRFAVGAAGSDKIPGAVLRAIVNVVDRGMAPQGAAADPACVITDDEIQISTELDRSVGERLAAIGLPLNPVSRVRGEHFGLLHIAARNKGRFAGGADTYWDGGVAYA